MRRRLAISASITAALASAVACVDLFHSTSDVHGICEVDASDASDPRCVGDGGVEAAPPELCAPEAGVAQDRAARACAWLAACSHPIGDDKTGRCMVNAILAYDCSANPDRKPKGAAAAFWQCMENPQSCADVGKCVFPDGVPGCTNGSFLGCSQSSANVDTRVDCVAKTDQPWGENCAAYGQTCNSLDPDASNNSATCIDPAPRDAGGQGRSCTSIGCLAGRYLTFCDDAGIDRGYDCADFGAGSCVPSGATPACKPEGTQTCAATNAITCTSGNVSAVGCVTGTPETVDCTAISGPGTCVPMEAGAPGTVPASACQVLDGGCTDDTCNGALLEACVRGRTVTIDCSKLGLKTCNPIITVEGDAAACNPP